MGIRKCKYNYFLINEMPLNELYLWDISKESENDAEGATLFAFYPHSNMQARQMEDGIGYYADLKSASLNAFPYRSPRGH